jgi:hypothetical protein
MGQVAGIKRLSECGDSSPLSVEEAVNVNPAFPMLSLLEDNGCKNVGLTANNEYGDRW